jgi:hypothetical protein
LFDNKIKKKKKEEEREEEDEKKKILYYIVYNNELQKRKRDRLEHREREREIGGCCKINLYFMSLESLHCLLVVQQHTVHFFLHLTTQL